MASEGQWKQIYNTSSSDIPFSQAASNFTSGKVTLIVVDILSYNERRAIQKYPKTKKLTTWTENLKKTGDLLESYC